METGYYWALNARDNKWQIVEIAARLPEHVLFGGYAWPRAAYSEFDGPIVRGATGTEGEINRLTNAGLDAAYGETMQADEAEHWIAACDRLTAERDALLTEVLALKREMRGMRIFGDGVANDPDSIGAAITDLSLKLNAAYAELHDLRIRAGLEGGEET